ncbi:hypothetical protein B4U79_19247, partial [Dinothrombium tinctorium]
MPAYCKICDCELTKDSIATSWQCSHTFHKLCLNEWIKLESRFCPICGTEMRE